MSKTETASKVLLTLPCRINLGSRGPHAELSSFDTAYKPHPSPPLLPPQPGKIGIDYFITQPINWLEIHARQ